MKIKRLYEKTPCGGDYSEIFFLDENHNLVDETVATEAIIRECEADGNLICETFMYRVKKHEK